MRAKHIAARAEGAEMIRRDFIKGTLAVSALGGCGLEVAERLGSKAQAVGGQAPNILVILVDEMRPPPGFPYGMPLVWQESIPNMLALWQESACFANHFTAASDCTPSRATLVTGMYAQQHWLLTTRTASASPQLQTQYPTYGKILSGTQYMSPGFTPYLTTWIGKWHLSNLDPVQTTNECPPPTAECGPGQLEAYGFAGGTCPDPIGIGSQGDTDDPDIAQQFSAFLDTLPSQPWCTTVSFVNPHDIQWFWNGTDAPDCTTCGPDALYYNNPPSYGWNNAYFEALAGGLSCFNFEDPFNTATPKPPMQQAFATSTAGAVGSISWNLSTLEATMPSPVCSGLGQNATKPYNYWYKLLQLYLYVQGLVDAQVGAVMAALNGSPYATNTIVIFTSDHGEYGGAHGQRGKGGMAYEEGMRVPFSVYDPTGLYVSQPGVVRTALTSSVDVTSLIATIANQGATPAWSGQTSYLVPRSNTLFELLGNPSAPGRSYVLYSTDEYFPGINPTVIASHVLSYRTAAAKLNVYSHWSGVSIDTTKNQDFEFYNYVSGDGGVGDVGELDNLGGAYPEALQYELTLLGLNEQGGLLASDLQGGVDESLVPAQLAAKAAYLAWTPPGIPF
jgi:hypothetical protein